jgi:LTXXQ motif family protein
LRAASAQAIEMLQSACPKDLPSIPTGRLAAMESRLQVMLAAVQIVRPALERFYQSLSDEQKARFNATLGAAKTVGPALAKFYNSLSDEQKARFNSLRSASRPAG